MTEFKPILPGILSLIAEEIGEDVAVALAKARGGRMLYIPKSVSGDHELSKLVGVEDAIKISKLLGHGNVLVPCGNLNGAAGRRTQITQLFEQGLTHSQIAAEVGVHIRTVERATARFRDENQPMFDFTDPE